MAKTNYFFAVKKNLDKGGAWLAIVSDEINGPILKAAAFSSAAPAKRWAAEQIDRSRLQKCLDQPLPSQILCG